MATEKVGIYRKYHGPIPKDKHGNPLPKNEWIKKRTFRWAVRWFGSDGKRYSKSFKTRKEAERYAEKRQTEVRQGRADQPAKISLREFFKEHSVLMKGNLANKTLQMHLATIELMAEFLGWNQYLHRISTRDVEKFRSYRLAKEISASTANKEVKTLRRIFNLAILRGHLPRGSNPCNGIPMLRVSPKRPQYVDPSDFNKIYNSAVDSLWRALLVTFYTSGIRLREALNLAWRDIDFESAQLYVTRKSKEGYIQAWAPKDHEMRIIPLPGPTISLLAAWQATAPIGCPYVFMDHGRWDYYSHRVDCGKWRQGQDLVNNVLRRFKTLCRRAGVESYTIHDLRRSCITNWAKRLQIHVVQLLAGHSDIKTTQKYYLSVQPEDIANAQAVQEALLSDISKADLTDPKVTHFGGKRVFPGRKDWQKKSQVIDNK